MRRKCAQDLTSVSAALAVMLLLAAHGGFIPQFSTHESGAAETSGNDHESGDREGTSAPLDLLSSLPGAMLIRVHAPGPNCAAELRSGRPSRATACGRLDPTKRSEMALAALAGAYHLISSRREAYLARLPVGPVTETRTPRDPALTSSISILGPPSS